ncbi:type VII secretion target [Actinoplanes sp. L3-i22]|uniref:type VII secretion target n=1 Tax=Actinoplanes sp. L3-i22 TaxID=2836373 RepID=UPI001C862FFA|nr:type VII secretion target [Actinoplanes sp. L3-i22]
MNPDLDVDTRHLQAVATALDATASRVREAAASAPAPAAGPRWSAVDAALRAADTLERGLRDLAADLTTTANKIKTTIAAYDDTDARAATRLRATR